MTSARTWLLLAVYWAGCSGAILNPAPGSPARAAEAAAPPDMGDAAIGAAADGGGIAASDCAGAAVDPGPMPLRALTRSQYLNTVHDLVGDVSGLAAALGDVENPSAFGLVQADVDSVQLENYQNAAELIAAAVANDAKRLAAIAPCASGADQRGCARTFVQSFGARAYRAPLTAADDIDALLALYDVGKTTSHAHGIELMLRAMLQAPRFLYRVEVGTDERVGPHAVKLSDYELAARLSYTVWDSMPDPPLMAAAANGELADPAAVRARLVTMLQDAKGQRLVARFLEQWIHLGDLDGAVKDASRFPAWTPALRAALSAQASRFFDHILQDEAGALSALLTSRTVFVNAALNDYYGVKAGADFQALTLDAEHAAGVLTLPALLGLLAKPDESSPIYRGKFVRESLLCQQLPAPPPNIPKPPAVTAGVSTRERLKQHEVDPACSGCHQLMDPIGFAFERFDAVGRYRDQDGAAPVDASGELNAAGDASGAIDGVAQLGTKLAHSQSVRDCVATQWFRFALARFERASDACSLAHVTESFSASDADLNSLPSALVESAAFMYRRPRDQQADP